MSGSETISISADAGAVEIDIGLARMLVVQALAGVLLEMQPGDADLARRPVGQVEDDPAMPDDRLHDIARSDSPPADRDRSSSCGRRR